MSNNQILQGFILGQRAKGHTGGSAVISSGSGGSLPEDYIKGYTMGLGSVGWYFYPTFDPEGQGLYLTFSSTSDFSITRRSGFAAKTWDGDIEYSTDTRNWTVWDGTTAISSADGVLYLRGSGNTVIFGNVSTSYTWLLSGAQISCTGNLETLLDYQTVRLGGHPAMDDYCFAHLFYDNHNLVSAPDFSGGTISKYCFYEAFAACTGLVSGVDLTVDEIPASACDRMYYECTSLVNAPALDAAKIGDYGCRRMFYGCSALAFPPSLQLETVGIYGASEMFRNCSSLQYLPSLADGVTLGAYCYANMFTGTTARINGQSYSSYLYPFVISGTASTGSTTYMFDAVSTYGEINTPTVGVTYYANVPVL